MLINKRESTYLKNFYCGVDLVFSYGDLYLNNILFENTVNGLMVKQGELGANNLLFRNTK